jgi:hypothetical protein
MSHLFRFVSILISMETVLDAHATVWIAVLIAGEDFQGRLTHSYITSHNLTPLKACRSKYTQNISAL